MAIKEGDPLQTGSTTDGTGSPGGAAVVAAAAATDAAAAKESPLPRWWRMAMQFAAALAAVFLLVVGTEQWVDAPDAQIGKTTIDGKEIVVTKETTTTAADGGETVVKEPTVAVAGRSESVLIAFLGLGTVLLVAAALPGRNLTVKAGPLDVGVTSLAAVAAKAAEVTEEEVKKQGFGPAKAGAAGAIAAQDAVVRYPDNLAEQEPGAMQRVLGRFGGSVPARSDVASKAAEVTVEQAKQTAVAQVLG